MLKCNSINYFNINVFIKEYINKFNLCRCGNIGNKYCIKNSCNSCDINCFDENCEIHKYRLRLCKCGKKYFDNECNDNLCVLCCKNELCSTHFILCNCKIKKVKINTICKSKSCCSTCCNNSHCYFHFNTTKYLTTKDLNYYKFLLIKKLPLEIVNYIINEYLDNRIICNICNYKFKNLSKALDNDNIQNCEICDDWICNKTCSKEIFSGTKLSIWCNNCK